MFGSEIVSKFILEHLNVVIAAESFSGKAYGLPILPQAVPLPAIAFYPEYSVYNAAMGSGSDISYEGLRFVVKTMIPGTSTATIRSMALAQIAHFDGRTESYTYDGVTYQISFTANGELLPTTVVDGATFYRQLGTIYKVDVTRGG